VEVTGFDVCAVSCTRRAATP